MKSSKTLQRFALVACLVAASTAVVAQEFPTKPVQIIVPFPAGMASDIVARVVAGGLGSLWKKGAYIDNRGGGASIPGMMAGKNAPADGYTLTIASVGPVAINPALHANLSYDPAKDFVMINGVFSVPLVIVASSSTSFRSLKDVVDAATKNPGTLNLGVPGTATIQHVAAESFKQRANVKMNSIQYRGSSQMLTEVLGGHVTIAIDSVTTALQHIKAGKLIPLAVTSEKRIPQLPDTPTVAELGYPGFQASGWVGVFAPKKTPEELVRKISADFRTVLAMPDVQKAISENGGVVDARGTQEWTRFVGEELKNWKDIVTSSGVTAE